MSTFNCAVCLETLGTKPQVPGCGHPLCNGCFVKVQSAADGRRAPCPTCRQPIGETITMYAEEGSASSDDYLVKYLYKQLQKAATVAKEETERRELAEKFMKEEIERRKLAEARQCDLERRLRMAAQEKVKILLYHSFIVDN